MITTEIAFNEAFNLEKALLLIEGQRLHPNYLMQQHEINEFNNLFYSIEYNSNVYTLLEMIFTQKKQIEHLMILNKINSGEIKFIDILKDINDSMIPSHVKYELVNNGYKLITVK